MESLQALFTNKTEFEYKGVLISINEVTIGDLPLITRLIEKFITLKGDTQEKIITLIKDDLDQVSNIISSLSSIPKQDVSKLSLDATIFILSKIVLMNIAILKKNIPQIVESVKAEVQKTGLVG